MKTINKLFHPNYYYKRCVFLQVAAKNTCYCIYLTKIAAKIIISCTASWLWKKWKKRAEYLVSGTSVLCVSPSRGSFSSCPLIWCDHSLTLMEC